LSAPHDAGRGQPREPTPFRPPERSGASFRPTCGRRDHREHRGHAPLRAADHGYVLQTGSIVHSGPAAELLADERIVEAYLGIETGPERP
jgi:hypothetical protein